MVIVAAPRSAKRNLGVMVWVLGLIALTALGGVGSAGTQGWFFSQARTAGLYTIRTVEDAAESAFVKSPEQASSTGFVYKPAPEPSAAERPESGKRPLLTTAPAVTEELYRPKPNGASPAEVTDIYRR